MTDSPGYCRSCDYDLRGLPEKHRCPECGREFDRADPSSVRKRPRRGIWKKLRWVVYPILLVVLAASAGVGWTWWEWRREQPAIAWAQGHGGGISTKPIGPDWLAKRAGRLGYLLERADVLGAESDQRVTGAAFPLSRLRHLRVLGLIGQGMGDDLMAEVGPLRELKELVLAYTAITDKGLSHLASCQRLEGLSLPDSQQVDDKAVHILKGLTKLKKLYLVGTKITPAGVAELKKALPNCQIVGP
ncbi:MAG: hypothetical protein K8T91_02005 [Planctomycetes bacterium]|nr:hypothetical protein [Planctomycetota bacterium]